MDHTVLTGHRGSDWLQICDRGLDEGHIGLGSVLRERRLDVDDRDSEARMVAEAVVHDELPDDPRAPGYQQRLGSHLPPP
jgi:hypothetical protein